MNERIVSLVYNRRQSTFATNEPNTHTHTQGYDHYLDDDDHNYDCNDDDENETRTVKHIYKDVDSNLVVKLSSLRCIRPRTIIIFVYIRMLHIYIVSGLRKMMTISQPKSNRCCWIIITPKTK